MSAGHEDGYCLLILLDSTLQLRNSFYALMTGYLANLALPRIGEITRCVALGKKEKIPVDQLIGTVVVERTIDFFSLLIIMIILIFTSGDQIGPVPEGKHPCTYSAKSISDFRKHLDPMGNTFCLW